MRSPAERAVSGVKGRRLRTFVGDREIRRKMQGHASISEVWAMQMAAAGQHVVASAYWHLSTTRVQRCMGRAVSSNVLNGRRQGFKQMNEFSKRPSE